MKKIALFSHSSSLGGAETAFVNLVKLVKSCGHEPFVFLPSQTGELVYIFKALSIQIGFFDRKSIYGNTSNALLEFSNRKLHDIESVLKQQKCELVISNSSVFIEGATAAAHLGLPHIWSIHEMQQQNPEQPVGGLADGAFARWFAALSDHQIFCSHSTRTAHESKLTVMPKGSVLPPFLESANDHFSNRPRNTNSDVVNLMFIGAPTVRKNPVFAIELTSALRARGRNVHLNFLGGRRDQTGLVENLLARRKLKSYVNFLGKVTDPYLYFSGKAINLICSNSEPFGLTVPESLSRGFPVIAPNMDGPSETLDPKYQYDLNNLDQCVRLIEVVIDQYDDVSRDALENYQKLRPHFLPGYQAELVAAAIKDAFDNFRFKEIPFEFRQGTIANAVEPEILSQDRVIDSIAVATNSTRDLIKEKVNAEQQKSGGTVNKDMKIFNVVPYQPSPQMDELYRSGHGFVIEAAANCNDSTRIKTAAFILVRLCTERTRLGRNLKILVVGDGIGVDSIRLASAGFDVDYMKCMNSEPSVTSKVVAENFSKFQNSKLISAGTLRILDRNEIEAGTYDAVISLEVIEHVQSPQDFLYFMQQQLMAGGVLFLSDDFPCIKDYSQTHLLSNERLSGLVPLMAAQCGLSFQGFCQNPLYKPYVFQRSDTPINQLMSEVLTQSSVIEMIVREQTKLVKARIRKIDKLIYIFKRLAINLRGYLARRRLAS